MPAPRNPAQLDEVDRAILAALVADGRLTNAALAARVGIAESTCIHRVRALRDAGVITGFHAEVDLARLGVPLQAVIKVRLGSHNRDHVTAFHRVLAGIPGALRIFHVAGEDDYLVHVAVASTEELRDLVLEHINVHPVVRHTETHLVFEVIPGAGVLPQTGERSAAAVAARPSTRAQSRARTASAGVTQEPPTQPTLGKAR